MLWALSPVAGWYFEDPQLIRVLWVLAACQVLVGFSNVGMTLARKELQFQVEFYYLASHKTLSVLATIVSAYFCAGLPRAGGGGGVRVFVAADPQLPHAPLSPALEHHQDRRHLGSDQKWLMLAGVGGFLRRSDELAAGRIGTTAEF